MIYSTTKPSQPSRGEICFINNQMQMFNGIAWVPIRTEPVKCRIVDFYPSRVEPSWWSVEFDRMDAGYFHILNTWLTNNDIWYWWAGDEDGIFEFKNKEDAMMFYLAFR